jgi:hypothetical protein
VAVHFNTDKDGSEVVVPGRGVSIERRLQPTGIEYVAK